MGRVITMHCYACLVQLLVAVSGRVCMCVCVCVALIAPVTPPIFTRRSLSHSFLLHSPTLSHPTLSSLPSRSDSDTRGYVIQSTAASFISAESKPT